MKIYEGVYIMGKFNKKVMAIVGTATLAVGIIAFPVLARTTQQQGNGWVV